LSREQVHAELTRSDSLDPFRMLCTTPGELCGVRSRSRPRADPFASVALTAKRVSCRQYQFAGAPGEPTLGSARNCRQAGKASSTQKPDLGLQRCARTTRRPRRRGRSSASAACELVLPLQSSRLPLESPAEKFSLLQVIRRAMVARCRAGTFPTSCATSSPRRIALAEAIRHRTESVEPLVVATEQLRPRGLHPDARTTGARQWAWPSDSAIHWHQRARARAWQVRCSKTRATLASKGMASLLWLRLRYGALRRQSNMRSSGRLHLRDVTDLGRQPRHRGPRPLDKRCAAKVIGPKS
jgi:hypothetical protein